VHEEVPDRDQFLPSAAEFRKVVRDSLIYPQLAAIDEHHRGGGRGDDFGERRQVVHRSLGIDTDFRLPIQRTVPLLPDDSAMSPNDHRRAGKAAGGDASAHDLVDARESRRGHPDGLGRDMR
jgi:hypothetical protein